MIANVPKGVLHERSRGFSTAVPTGVLHVRSDEVLHDRSHEEVWWADLRNATDSGPGFRRPVVVVQGNALNRSRPVTVVCVPLTSNLTRAEAPGNMLLSTKATKLPKDSVANALQIITIDCALLTERVGRLTPRHLEQILHGIDLVLGR